MLIKPTDRNILLIENMTSDTWKMGNVLKFIKLYGEHPILWDQKNQERNNAALKREAWEKIAKGLNGKYPIDELIKKKKSLMAAYRHCIRRKHRSGLMSVTWYGFMPMHSYLGPLYESKFNSETNDWNEETSEFLEDNFEEVDTLEEIDNTQQEQEPSEEQKTVKEYIIVRTRKRPAEEEEDECDLFAKLLAAKLRKLSQSDREKAMNDIDNLMYKITSKS